MLIICMWFIHVTVFNPSTMYCLFVGIKHCCLIWDMWNQRHVGFEEGGKWGGRGGDVSMLAGCQAGGRRGTVHPEKWMCVATGSIQRRLPRTVHGRKEKECICPVHARVLISFQTRLPCEEYLFPFNKGKRRLTKSWCNIEGYSVSNGHKWAYGSKRKGKSFACLSLGL